MRVSILVQEARLQVRGNTQFYKISDILLFTIVLSVHLFFWLLFFPVGTTVRTTSSDETYVVIHFIFVLYFIRLCCLFLLVDQAVSAEMCMHFDSPANFTQKSRIFPFHVKKPFSEIIGILVSLKKSVYKIADESIWFVNTFVSVQFWEQFPREQLSKEQRQRCNEHITSRGPRRR